MGTGSECQTSVAKRIAEGAEIVKNEELHLEDFFFQFVGCVMCSRRSTEVVPDGMNKQLGNNKVE